MRAIVLNGNQAIFDPNRAIASPRPGEVMVRVLRAGVCETDLQLVRGYMEFNGVLGHEFVGIAESGPCAGHRVVGEINCSCWECQTCVAGRPTHCPNRTTIGIANHDGAFADFVAVPQRNLHLVPDSMPTDVAVFAEPVAAAFQIPNQLTLNRTDRVVVLGDGRLGNPCAQVLSSICDSVLVVGKHREKLALLGDLGIETALLDDLTTQGPVLRQAQDRPEQRRGAANHLRQGYGGPPKRDGSQPRAKVEAGRHDLNHQADVVVDCTGSDTGLPTALTLVRPRGTIVLKTTVAGSQQMPWAPVVIDEVTIVGSRCGPFDRALEALEAGSVSVLPMISERYDLSRGVDALQAAAGRGVLKVLIDVQSE